MRTISFFILLIVCVSLFPSASSAFIMKPLPEASEDRGKGITDQEVNFIKARIIEVAKLVGQNA